MYYVLFGNEEDEYTYKVLVKLGQSRVLKIASDVFEVEDILNDDAIGVITDAQNYKKIETDLNAIGFKRYFCMFEDKRKCAIVGAGADGRRTFIEVGAENVECFVDNYKSGTVLFGKKVVSVLELKKIKEEYRIIISSRNYKYVLEKQLLQNGIEDYEIYPETIECSRYPYVSNYGCERKITYSEILANNHVDQYNKIAVFCRDDNEKELVLELCIQCGINRIYGIVRNKADKHRGFLGIRYISIDELDGADCLVIGVNFGDSDIRYRLMHKECCFSVIDIFKVSDFLPAFHYESIKKYRNINTGERCFIIGNGPSLTVEDLDKLYSHKEISFACNGINLVFNKTKWRPQYYCLSDPWAIQSFTGMEDPKIISFLCDYYQSDAKYERKNNVEYIHYVRQGFRNHPCFSDDVSCSSYEGGNAPYDICLQLAVYMGFKEIFLLGIDNTVLVEEESNHFDKDYDVQMSNMIPDDAIIADEMMNSESYKGIIDRSFETAKWFLKNRGVNIYNATRGGRLEVFERVNFDSLFT